ncbi:unnamed protein product [Thlaspi arvense]|uniref:F-box domain-containing protein n=1 Tax=Thlaspi arvense TaxID=13288 RepID=A0AAU9R4V3_THLAR|nr:unnamed protein product [Thlaspi arvense]
MSVADDMVEDILLRLPLKSIFRFKTVSKQWKATVESRWFAERRASVKKGRKLFLAVGDESESRFEGDAETEMVYLRCEDATRPSLTCNGLVCIPLPGWVKVLNPLTGEFLRFPSGQEVAKQWWHNVFPGYWAMGFGKDQVNGSYKIVRMLSDPNHCLILDISIGEWRELSPPPCEIESDRKSACVNGSVYWLNMFPKHKLLALDLHTEEFRVVSADPPPRRRPAAQIVNLEGRLAIGETNTTGEWKLEVWCMDAQEETWTMTYNILLSSITTLWCRWHKTYFTPLAVSEGGSLFFTDNNKTLFKYYPDTDSLRCPSPGICVVSPLVENLVRFTPPTGGGYVFKITRSGQVISSFVRRVQFGIPNVLLTL